MNFNDPETDRLFAEWLKDKSATKKGAALLRSVPLPVRSLVLDCDGHQVDFRDNALAAMNSCGHLINVSA